MTLIKNTKGNGKSKKNVLEKNQKKRKNAEKECNSHSVCFLSKGRRRGWRCWTFSYTKISESSVSARQRDSPLQRYERKKNWATNKVLWGEQSLLFFFFVKPLLGKFTAKVTQFQEWKSSHVFFSEQHPPPCACHFIVCFSRVVHNSFGILMSTSNLIGGIRVSYSIVHPYRSSILSFYSL
jgi:hypothetical protein